MPLLDLKFMELQWYMKQVSLASELLHYAGTGQSDPQRWQETGTRISISVAIVLFSCLFACGYQFF